MTPLPVITDVYRVVYNWTSISGVSAVNVIHVSSDSSAEPGDVLNTVLDVQSDHRDMWNFLPQDQTLDSLVVTKLDGTSASVTGSLSGVVGTGTASVVPAVAALLHIGTGQRGPRGRGRVYIGPTTEDLITSGHVNSTPQGTAQTAWNDFADDLDGALSHPCQLGVASYVHADFHVFSSLVLQGLTATQRRRQDQLR